MYLGVESWGCGFDSRPDCELKTKTERLSVFGSALFYGGSNPPDPVGSMQVRVLLRIEDYIRVVGGNRIK